jgi:hypothetical protein
MSTFSVMLCNSRVSIDTLTFRSGEKDLVSLEFDELMGANFSIGFSYEQAQKVVAVLQAAITEQEKRTAALKSDLSEEYTLPVSSDELKLLQSGGSAEVDIGFDRAELGEA